MGVDSLSGFVSNTQIWLNNSWVSLNTPQMHRLEAALGLILVFGASVFLARNQIRDLRDLNPAFLVRQFPGASPKRKSTIQKRIKKLRSYQKSMALRTGSRLLLAFLFSIVIPAAVFAVIAYRYNWFFPGQTLFVDAANTAHSIAAPSGPTIIAFIVDQILRAPSDAAEIFGFHASQVSIVPHAYLADGALLAFRTFAGGAIYSILYATYLFVRALLTPNTDIEKWQSVLNGMQ